MPSYKNPPIREALIDIRVEGVTEAALASFRGVRDQLHAAYPSCEDVQEWHAEVKVGPRQPTATAVPQLGRLVGYFFRSADQKYLAQFRIDGFTLNRFRPYEGWDALLAEALSLWGRYRAAACPSFITRLAVRTTNLIEVPESRLQLGDYFAVEVPDFLGERQSMIEDFTVRSLVVLSDSSTRCIVNFGSQKPAGQGSAFLLDTDVFSVVRLPPDTPRLRDLLLEFRAIKNDIFESALKPRTKEAFE